MTSIAAISLQIEHLEPVSPSLPRLAGVLSDPNSSLEDIVSIIEFDPALTANTLKFANSAYFSFPSPVATVHEAVQQIGAGRILKHAVGVEIGRGMTGACPGYDLEEQELWNHSVAAATAAALLPSCTKVSLPSMSFTAALLHDFGKLVISRYLDDATKDRIQSVARDRHVSSVDAERIVLGFDHAQVGGLIARRWHFPEELAECITYHHAPRENGRASLALDVVHVCNAVAIYLGLGLGHTGMNVEACADSAKALGLTPESLEKLCAATMDELPGILELYQESVNVED